MRLVRFEDESGGFAIELHPLLTVVSGLPHHIRERLIQTISALPHGGDPGGRGSVEVYGVYLELNRETLDLLELDQELDVVLKPGDLPGSNPDDGDPGNSPSDDADGGDVASAPAVVAARRVLADADIDYQAAQRSLESLQQELEETEAERVRLTQRIDSMRTGVDSFAIAGLQAARAELADLEAKAAAEADAAAAHEAESHGDGAPSAEVGPPAEADPELAEIEARIEELIAESNRLKLELKRLRSIDAQPVRRAHRELVEAMGGSEESVSPEAEALSTRWVYVNDRVADLARQQRDAAPDMATLVAHRDRAYEQFTFAQNAMRSPTHDAAVVAELERIHDEIFETGGKGLRFGSAKNKRRREELRATEVELLDRLGFDTWTSYVMGASSPEVTQRRRAAMDAAHQDYERAEAAIAAAQQDGPDDDAVELEEARQELAAIHRSICHFLGFDPGLDPLPALQDHRVPREQPVEGLDVLTAALRQALLDTGAELPARSLTHEELESIASGWLEAIATLPERIADADTVRAQIEVEIDQLVERFERSSKPQAPMQTVRARSAGSTEQPESTATPTLSGPQAIGPKSGGVNMPLLPSPEILAAQFRVRDAERRAAGTQETTQETTDLQAELEAINISLRDMRRELDDRQDSLSDAARRREDASDDLQSAERGASSAMGAARHPSAPRERMTAGSAGAEAVEWYVLARLAQQRSVSFVGSVPIVIDDAFAQWSIDELRDVFERMERMSEVIQIVMLTDDSDVSAWARGLGSSRASVLDLRSSVAG